MKTYYIKKIIDGTKIQKTGKYVAVPNIDYDKGTRFDDNEPFKVVYKGKAKVFDSFKNAETYRTFGDRLKRGTYRLGYFKWAEN